MEQNSVKAVLKAVLGAGATIGASAVAGFLLKGAGLSGITGFKKIFVPLGVFGLASAAGQMASNAVEHDIDEAFGVADMFKTPVTAPEDDILDDLPADAAEVLS